MNETHRKIAKQLAEKAAKRCANKAERLNISVAVHSAVLEALAIVTDDEG